MLKQLLFIDMDGVIADFPEGKSFLWGRPNFWVTVPKFQWSDELVGLWGEQYDLHILSSTGGGPAATAGKMRWLQEHYPHLVQGAIFTKDKHLLAAPGRLLVDDDQEKCDAFDAAGGIAMLFNPDSAQDRLSPFVESTLAWLKEHLS